MIRGQDAGDFAAKNTTPSDWLYKIEKAKKKKVLKELKS